MACRPVFIPKYCGPQLVEERTFYFTWAPGFSPTQKKKNIVSLHNEARRHGIDRILEISSKSDYIIGQRLSAFNIKIDVDSVERPLESVYQGCKVFEGGGPFTDVFEIMPRDAKRYIKALNCGRLLKYEFQDKSYPLSPKNAFYDWLYIRSLEKHADWIRKNVSYDAFTDIEFNPAKQVNCQARAFAEYLSLLQRDKIREAAGDFEGFADTLNTI